MNSRDRWITASLGLLCAVMTFLLVRNEYFPESSLLQQVPPEYLATRMLRHAITSALKLEWRGESIGSLNLRITPGTTPRVSGVLQCAVPVLGKEHRLQLETLVTLKSPHQVERIVLRGRWQDTAFELEARASDGLVTVKAHGPGIDLRRQYQMAQLLQPDNRNPLATADALPEGLSQSQVRQIADSLPRWRIQAWSTRVHRFGDWMDAYLLGARMDENWWLKLWISPTGELLRLETSFGLRAINEDFFTRLEADHSSPSP